MVDVCIVGGGLAGLMLAKNLSSTLNVVIISDSFTKGNSWLAQGGIAAPLGESDAPSFHLQDTLLVGSKHVDGLAAKEIIEDGERLVRSLVNEGFPVDLTSDGALALGKEAAHSHHRVLHAGGDRTGKFWMKKATTATQSVKRMIASAHSLVMEDGTCKGVRIVTEQHQVETLYATTVVLATGGIGELFGVTSNSSAAKGTGLSLAYHAGARLTDLEFIQFHPTIAVDKQGTKRLVTEALRGAGAIFTDQEGTPLAINPLGPRDVTARLIDYHWRNQLPVFLDRTHVEKFSERFPTAKQVFKDQQRIAVRPGVHFHMGGIQTDLGGRTSIPGLYALGEVACTGLHGGNRLASNSLLECIVMGYRVAEDIQSTSAPMTGIRESKLPEPPTEIRNKDLSQESLVHYCGILRDESSETYANSLPLQQWDLASVPVHTIDLLHRYTTSSLLAQSVSLRKESRGAHFRIDFPSTQDEWNHKIIVHEGNQKWIETRNSSQLKERVYYESIHH